MRRLDSKSLLALLERDSYLERHHARPVGGAWSFPTWFRPPEQRSTR